MKSPFISRNKHARELARETADLERRVESERRLKLHALDDIELLRSDLLDMTWERNQAQKALRMLNNLRTTQAHTQRAITKIRERPGDNVKIGIGWHPDEPTLVISAIDARFNQHQGVTAVSGNLLEKIGEALQGLASR